jgi:hypothetical protein
MMALRIHRRNMQDLHWTRRLLHVSAGDARVSGSPREAQFGLRHAPAEIGLAMLVRIWFPARTATSRQESAS